MWYRFFEKHVYRLIMCFYPVQSNSLSSILDDIAIHCRSHVTNVRQVNVNPESKYKLIPKNFYCKTYLSAKRDILGNISYILVGRDTNHHIVIEWDTDIVDQHVYNITQSAISNLPN